jgi:hypothetical protein
MATTAAAQWEITPLSRVGWGGGRVGAGGFYFTDFTDLWGAKSAYFRRGQEGQQACWQRGQSTRLFEASQQQSMPSFRQTVGCDTGPGQTARRAHRGARWTKQTPLPHTHTHTHTHTHQKRAAAQAQVAQAVGSVVRKTQNRPPPAERAEAKNADRPTQGLPASGFREPGRKRGGNNNTTTQYFILAVVISRYSISCCRDTLSASDNRSSYSHVFFVETPRSS